MLLAKYKRQVDLISLIRLGRERRPISKQEGSK